MEPDPEFWSRRVTPRKHEELRIRSRIEKVLGVVTVVLGFALVIVNYLADLDGPDLLPGGHSPFYLLLGVAIAVTGTWWTGVFDRKGM